MSEPLSVSEVPSSLAQYVTDVGDSGKQANDGVSMMSLVIPHSVATHDSQLLQYSTSDNLQLHISLSTLIMYTVNN